MIALPLLLAAAAPATAGPPAPDAQRFERCLATARRDPTAAEQEATAWRLSGGGYLPRACLGMAFAARERWAAAAGEFDAAADGAVTAKDARAATFRAQAGNAWLAAGEGAKARVALDAALAAGTLDPRARGEATLDRARAYVAAGQLEPARADLDRALVDVPGDALAWLLSATLARRMHQIPRAQADIAEALKRAGDDATVQLEAGNIAALAGDEPGARAAWAKAAKMDPDGAVGRSASTALKQFD